MTYLCSYPCLFFSVHCSYWKLYTIRMSDSAHKHLGVGGRSGGMLSMPNFIFDTISFRLTIQLQKKEPIYIESRHVPHPRPNTPVLAQALAGPNTKVKPGLCLSPSVNLSTGSRPQRVGGGRSGNGEGRSITKAGGEADGRPARSSSSRRRCATRLPLPDLCSTALLACTLHGRSAALQVPVVFASWGAFAAAARACLPQFSNGGE